MSIPTSAPATPIEAETVFILRSRQVASQGGSSLLQRPIDLIAGDHKWRGAKNDKSQAGGS
jgi:hypothetical protein